MKRIVANAEIMVRLGRYLTQNPDIRFGQALRNLGIVVDFQKPPANPGEWNPVEWMNHFNEEPWDMLKRMDETKGEKNG